MTHSNTISSQKLSWNFPLPEAGAGVMMGNGSLGLMVWGTDRICLTVSRNGFWDRRDGSLPKVGANFSGLKRLLLEGKVSEASALFIKDKGPSHYGKPTQLPGARLELWAEGWKPFSAEVNLSDGSLEVRLEDGSGRNAGCKIHLARDRELAWVECDSETPELQLNLVPMWSYLGETLEKDGVKPPRLWDEKTAGGMVQSLPADPSLTLNWRWIERNLFIETCLGEPRAGLAQISDSELKTIVRKTQDWWQTYWSDVPRLTIPDAALQHIYFYGLYLQAGLTPAEGVAATLVGPWMEESLFPAWRNDYHFNINLQMIYWPCLVSNRADHLRPLWKMIGRWMPQLQANARIFFERDDAVMIPHAVDDLGHTVDDFWTGMVDHGCTAWVAIMAWLHYRFTLEIDLLQETAWPLLTGAFNGYWAMLEEIEEGGKRRLSLPVTVSPEYGGSGKKSWGRNASFQLSALHKIVEILPLAAKALGKEMDSRWEEVREKLPPYAIMEGLDLWTGEPAKRVALWEGQDLEVSHRHHSHLSLLYPFASIDPLAPEHREIMRDTLRHWLARGPGLWAGWSHPWTASLCAAADLPDAAVAWLHWWRNVYNNPGYGSDHNGDFAGCGVSNRGYLFPENPDERYRPVIQLDGAMGAVTAILEILVQTRKDVIHVLPRRPRRWRSFSFDGIRTERAFLVGASVENETIGEIRVTSLKGAPLKLRNPWGATCRINGVEYAGDLVEKTTRAGESLILHPPLA